MAEHYFTQSPTSDAKRREITLDLAGRTVTVETMSGTFSPTRLDPGTAVLLKHLPAPAPGDLLDLGAGWGPIALHSALQAADAEVDVRIWALDVNSRSLESTAGNAARLGLETVRPVTADEIPADLEFSTIRSNPPIRIGKEALHELLETWLPRLAPGGRADLVVSKNLGADSLLAWISAMLGEGFTAERTASAKGFRILTIHRD